MIDKLREYRDVIVFGSLVVVTFLIAFFCTR